jgi:hypothetical protein
MAEGTNNYEYKLRFGASIENTSESITVLDLVESAKNIPIENNTYSICLNGVKFTRKIYEPGLIEAEVTIKMGDGVKELPSMTAVTNLFLKRMTTLTITPVETKKSETIAKNYYVYQVIPVLLKNTGTPSYAVKLNIYSLDKLMTLDKYSKSYVAKKLASDILKNGCTRFGFQNDQNLVDFNNLKHLKYKNKSNEDAEMIQPYLVQYNESFYDFMVRTANRCGEFLYFENGKLTIGLPASSTAKNIETYDSVTMQDFSSNPLDINVYTRDSVKDDETISGFNADPIKKDDAGFPADAFPAKPSYNAELTHDDLIFPMKKDNFTSYTNELGINTKNLAVSAAKKIATNEAGYTGIPEMIRSFASDMATTAIGATKSTSKTNNDGNEDYIDILKDTAQSDGTTTVQFGTVVKNGWPTLEFYTNVRRQEDAQQQNMVCINMGVKYNSVSLGDKITIDGLDGNYIVTHVAMCSGKGWTHNYKEFLTNDQTDVCENTQSMQIWAIPTYQENNTETAIPPVLNVPYIRKSGPQTAFIVDNGDPKKQGRVRIAYPWQSGSEVVRQALFTAKEEKKSAEKKLDDLKKQLQELPSTAKSEDREAAKKKLEEAQKDLDIKKEDVKNKAKAWSKDLKSVASPWIRVVSPMATDGGGAYFLPNPGDEVLVNYDNDNIERPYVVGSVYSKNLNEPNSGHDGAITLQSPNGQFITLTAAGGKKFLESIAPVLKPLQTLIPPFKDAMKTVDKGIGGGITLSDAYGMFKIDMSSHGRKIDIESPFGKVGISAFTGITINAPNGDIKIRGKNVSIEAGNNLSLKSGTNVNYSDFSLADTIKDMLKDTVKEVAEASLDLVDASSLMNMKVVDCALIRCVVDTFLKPIEGTLCIKSNNYMMLEAGKGKVEVPLERYSDSWQDYKKAEKDGDKQIVYSKIATYAKRFDQKITQFCSDYTEAKKRAYKKQKAYTDFVTSIVKDESKLQTIVKDAYKLGENEYKKYDKDTNTEGLVKTTNFKQDNVNDKSYRVSGLTYIRTFDDMKSYYRTVADEYAEAVYEVQRIARSAKTVISGETVKAVNKSVVGRTEDDDTKWIDDIFKTEADDILKTMLDEWNNRYGSGDPKEVFLSAKDENSDDDPFTAPQLYKRVAFTKMLVKMHNDPKNAITVPPVLGVAVGGAPSNPGKFFKLSIDTNSTVDKAFVKKNWQEIAKLGDAKKTDRATRILQIAAEFLGIDKQWKPLLDPKAPLLGWAQKVWNDKSGQILFSNKKGATYNLNGEEIEKFEFRTENNKESLKKTLLEFGHEEGFWKDFFK